MNVGPGLAVCPDLDERHVEGPMRCPDVDESGERAGVAAVKDAMPGAGHGPRRPERVITVVEAASGKVARRGRGERERAHRGGLGPVELRDTIRGNTPSLQMRADAKRNDEARTRLGHAPSQ